MDDCAFQLSSSIIFAQVITSTANGKKLTSKFRPDIKCPNTKKWQRSSCTLVTHLERCRRWLVDWLLRPPPPPALSPPPALIVTRDDIFDLNRDWTLAINDTEIFFFGSVIAGRRQPLFWCVALRFCVSCSRDTERSVLPLMPDLDWQLTCFLSFCECICLRYTRSTYSLNVVVLSRCASRTNRFTIFNSSERINSRLFVVWFTYTSSKRSHETCWAKLT